MGKKKRRSYTKEFKEETVSHWQDSGKTADEIATALGIPNGKYLTRWKNQMQQKGSDAFPGNGQLLGKDAEISQLRKELKDMKQERDILKKALWILSKL